MSVRMEQTGSHWTDFHDSWHLSIFRKSVEKIKVSLKSDKNKDYFIWRPMCIFYHMSLSSHNEKCFRQSCREIRNTFYVQYLFFFLFENRTVYEIMCTFGKNTQQIFIFFQNVWNKLARWKYCSRNETYTFFLKPLFLYVRKTD